MRADVRAVAVVQTMRVIVLSAGLPTALMLLGYSDPSQAGGADDRAAAIGELAVLIPFSSLAAYLLSRAGFPGGWLFGAMLGSAVLHGSGLIEAWLPLWLSNVAMITLGAVTGSRFTGTRSRCAGVPRCWSGSTAVSMSIAALFALLCISMLSVQPADVVIAFAPGAQETMLLLALALHLDPVFVGAHHVARFLLVSLTIPLVVQRTKRQTDKTSRTA
jgi:membrane AbrB-like protein